MVSAADVNETKVEVAAKYSESGQGGTLKSVFTGDVCGVLIPHSFSSTRSKFQAIHPKHIANAINMSFLGLIVVGL